MICPNCGATLPNTVTLCFSCRTKFDHSTHTYYMPEDAKYFPKNANINVSSESHTDNLRGYQGQSIKKSVQLNPEQQQINQLRQHIQYQQQQINQMQNSSNNMFYYLGLVFGIISGVLVLVSVFMPFITVSVFGFSESASLSDVSKTYLVLSVIFCLGLVIDSIFMHGRSNIAVGIMIMAYSIYCYVQVNNNINENELSGIAQLGMGFYLVILSGIIAVISGILLVLHNNQE